MATKDWYTPKSMVVPKVEVERFGLSDVPCFVVGVTGSDYEMCDKIAHTWHANKKPGAFGSGLRKTPNDPCKPVRVGLLGKVAFAQVFGGDVLIKTIKGGTRYDFEMNGLQTVRVKMAMGNRENEGLVQSVDEYGKVIKLESEIYVFGYMRYEERINYVAQLCFVGAMRTKDVMSMPQKPGKLGKGHMNYVVPYSKMEPMDKLLGWWKTTVQNKAAIKGAKPEWISLSQKFFNLGSLPTPVPAVTAHSVLAQVGSKGKELF